MKNYIELKTEQHKLEYELMNVKSKINRFYGTDFIELAINKTEIGGERQFDNFATVLSEELTERDWPYTEENLREIFVFSGRPFTDDDIQNARPDSQECQDEEVRRWQD